MVQKKRKLTDDFKKYNLIRKSPAFPHLLKKARLEKTEGTRALQEYAGKRMSFLLNSLYPEMSAERKQQLINKIRANTDLMPYHIFRTDGQYSPNLEHIRIRKKLLNDRAYLTNVLDHEAIHLLSYEFRHLNPHEVVEFIARGISSSIVLNKQNKVALRKLKAINFSNPDISVHLKNTQVGKKLSNVKTLREIETNPRAKYNLPSPFLITFMSRLLEKKLDLKARNQFLRDTMEGKNPVITFNNMMKQMDIQAVIEGKQLKIKKVKP